MTELPPNWIQTGLAVLAGGVFLSGLVQWLAKSLNEGRHAWSRALRSRMGVLPERKIGELRWVALGVQLTLWLLLGYVLLRLWNLDELGQDFIDKLGSRSSMTGKPYRVRLPDGREMDSATWMTGLLEEVRAMR